MSEDQTAPLSQTVQLPTARLTVGPPMSIEPIQPIDMSAQNANPNAISSKELRARLANILRVLANNPSYHKAVRSAFKVWDQVSTMVADTGVVGSVTSNDHLRTALRNARLFLEEFTGGRSLSPFIDNSYKFMKLLRDDPALQSYFKDVQTYILEALDNPSRLDDQERLKAIILKGRNFMQEVRFHDYTTTMLKEGSAILEALRGDALANQFTTDLRRLMEDLFIDSTGKPTWKPDALISLKHLVVGMFMDELKCIPIGAISGSTPEFEYAVSNITLTAFDLLPEDVNIYNKNKAEIHPMNIATPAPNFTQTQGLLKITVTKSNVVIPNVIYHARKFTSPRFEDNGLATVRCKNLKIKITVQQHYGEKYPHFFKVESVKAKIGKLSLVLLETEHRFFATLLKPMITSTMRKRIELAIAQGITNGVRQLEATLYQWIGLLPEQTRPALLEKFVPVVDDNKWTGYGQAAGPYALTQPYVPGRHNSRGNVPTYGAATSSRFATPYYGSYDAGGQPVYVSQASYPSRGARIY